MKSGELNIGDLVIYGGIVCQVGAISKSKQFAVIRNGKSIYKAKISILTKINS